MSVLRWLATARATPEDDTRGFRKRALFHARGGTKKSDRRTGVAACRSDSIRPDRICIAAPVADCEPDFNYNSPFHRPTVYRRSSKASPDSTGRLTVLRPTCITLLNILSKYDRNRCRSRHPAVDKLPPRPRSRSSVCVPQAN